MPTADNCPVCDSPDVTITTTSEYWEAYCNHCGTPLYLDDTLNYVQREGVWPWFALAILIVCYAIAAYVDIAL